MENFKPRDQHVRPFTGHIGQSHDDRDSAEQAAKAIDQGPAFGTPGDPPDADPDAINQIEKACEDANHERDVSRAR